MPPHREKKKKSHIKLERISTFTNDTIKFNFAKGILLVLNLKHKLSILLSWMM